MLGEVYIPILYNSSSLREFFSEEFLFSLYSAEILSLLLSIFLVFLILAISWHKIILHTNLNICLSYYYVVDLFMSFIRLVSIYREITGNVNAEWLWFFCEARVFFLATTLAGMSVVFIERVCATVYMGEYATKTGPLIPFISILLPNSAILGSKFYWTQKENLLGTGIAAILISSIAFTAYISLVKYNSIRLKRMYLNSTMYTLSNRYQADENEKVFRIMRNAFCIVSLHFIWIPATIVAAAFNEENKRTQTLLQFLTEFALSTLPIPTILTIILSTAEWRRQVFFCCAAKERRRIRPSEEKDVYFAHLKESWKSTYVRSDSLE